MIQQMIYRGTAQGYRTVAISADLKRSVLLRRLEQLCRMPGRGWINQDDPCPIIFRCAVGDGIALGRTVKDRGDNRHRSLTHLFYIPAGDMERFQACALDPALFLDAYQEKQDQDALPALAAEQALKPLPAQAANVVPDGAPEGLGLFLQALRRCAALGGDKGFNGVCVRLKAMGGAEALSVYTLLELALRIYPGELVRSIGYRTLWNGPENNVMFPVFFTTEALMPNPESLSAMRQVLFDSDGSLVLPRGVELNPNAVDMKIARGLLEGDAAAIDQIRETLRQELRRRIEEKRRAEEAEARRIAEEKRRAEEAEARRIAEEKRRAEEAEARRIAEEKHRAEEAEARRVAEEKRLAEEEAFRQAEEKRRAEEAEARRQAAEAEARRLAAEAEKKRLAEAEARRQAEEAERRRLEALRREVEAAEAKRAAAEAEAARLQAEAEEMRRAVEAAEAARLAVENRGRHALGVTVVRLAERPAPGFAPMDRLPPDSANPLWFQMQEDILADRKDMALNKANALFNDPSGSAAGRLDTVRRVMSAITEEALTLAPLDYRYETDYLHLGATIMERWYKDLFQLRLLNHIDNQPGGQKARLVRDILTSSLLLAGCYGIEAGGLLSQADAERLAEVARQRRDEMRKGVYEKLVYCRMMYGVFYALSDNVRNHQQCRRVAAQLSRSCGDRKLQTLLLRLADWAKLLLERSEYAGDRSYRCGMMAYFYALDFSANLPEVRTRLRRISNNLPELKNDISEDIRRFNERLHRS